METLNRVMLIGRLIDAPTKDNEEHTCLTVRTSLSRRKGDFQLHTVRVPPSGDFLNPSLADYCLLLKTGILVYVEGSLQPEGIILAQQVHDLSRADHPVSLET